MTLYIPEILKSSSAIVALSWLAFGRYVMIAIYTMLVNASKDIRIRDKTIARMQTYRELLSIWHYPLDALVLIIMIAIGLFNFANATFANIIGTFIFIFLWAEISYYWLHRLMHRYDFLWKFHELHHKSITVQPLTAGCFSIVEHLGLHTITWLIPTALLSWYFPISFNGIILFYIYYYFITSVAHANIELSPKWIREMPLVGNIANSSTGHALHHSLYTYNYGFSTNLFDKLHGTYSYKTNEILDQIEMHRENQKKNSSTQSKSQLMYKKSQYKVDYHEQ